MRSLRNSQGVWLCGWMILEFLDLMLRHLGALGATKMQENEGSTLYDFGTLSIRWKFWAQLRIAMMSIYFCNTFDPP